jgi:hypothetical protein
MTLTPTELRTIVREAVREEISPWLTMRDMMQRYNVETTHTITARERKGKLPKRADNDMWLRSEVNDWDANIKKAA